MLASSIGLRAKATAIDVPSSIVLGVLGGEQQREERVVAGLGRPDARVARLLGSLASARRVGRSNPMPPSTFMGGTVVARRSRRPFGVRRPRRQRPGRAGSARARRPARRPTGRSRRTARAADGVSPPRRRRRASSWRTIVDVLGVARHQLVELLAVGRRRRCAAGWRSTCDAGHLGEAVEQGHRAAGYGKFGDVVRHLRPQADGRHAERRRSAARGRPAMPAGTSTELRPIRERRGQLRRGRPSSTAATGGCAAWRTGRRRGRPSAGAELDGQRGGGIGEARARPRRARGR